MQLLGLIVPKLFYKVAEVHRMCLVIQSLCHTAMYLSHTFWQYPPLKMNPGVAPLCDCVYIQQL